MNATPEQIEAAKELAQVMKEWDWQEDDRYLWLAPSVPTAHRITDIDLIRREDYQTERILFPDVEQCLRLLKEWGWQWLNIVHHPNQCMFVAVYLAGGKPDILLTAPDPTTAAIKALAEAVRRR